jgi:ABC-type sugar transport system permease subunit
VVEAAPHIATVPVALRRPRARLLLRTRRSRRAVLVWCFLAPALAIFLLYRIIPLVWNGVLSFQDWSPYRPAEWAGLVHYEEMLFYDDVFWQSLWNTLIFMTSAPIGIAVALFIAVLVNADIRGRDVYRTVVFVSYPLMTVAVGIIWRWLYDERVGLINYTLQSLGIIEQPIAFLQSFDWALPAVIAASIWQTLGFYMIILLTGLQNIPQNLYEAAAVDGVGRWPQFWRVTLPLLRPSLFLCCIIGILNSFTSFDLVYVMTNGGPGHATELLVTYVYKLGFVQTQFDYAAAVTVVQFLLLLLLAWLANRATGGNAGATDRD